MDEKSGEAALIDVGGFDNSLKSILENEEIKKVKYILLTHGHYDHLLGVYDAKEHTGAKVAIHKMDKECLTDENSSLAYQIESVKQKPVEPDIILKDGMKLNVGNIELEVLHTPGHSKGSVCFVCESERIIFSGDTLFLKTYGRTDLQGGSWSELQLSLNKLALLEGDYIVYPGHFMQTSLDFERKHNRYMRRNK